MSLSSLCLKDWRNYEQVQLNPHPMLNIFLGPNGQGKTNLLESIYYLCYGKNFRGNKERELVHWRKDYFRIEAMFSLKDGARVHHQEVYYDDVHHKVIKENGVRYKSMRELPARMSAVLFTPDDLSVVKGGPTLRRRYLDQELDALYGDYERIRRAYERVLNQRGELLCDIRMTRAKREMLAPWNAQLAAYGSAIIMRRLALLATLVPQARRVHAFLAKDAGAFDVTYQSSLGPVLGVDEQTMQQTFIQLLEEVQEEDIARGTTSVGPHRDDLVFYENGVDLRTYGSRGQGRTAILAMKMAAIDVYEKTNDYKPILLLDDVLSELDYERQQAVMEIVIKKHIQTFITAAHIDFTFNQFGYDPVQYISGGKLINNLK